MNSVSESIRLDKFYTCDKAAERFITFVSSYVDLGTFDNIIEPSAGAGALLNYLPSQTIGIDIEPEAEGIIKHDFLSWQFPIGRNITIGNPPFGVRSYQAVEFFKHAALHCDVIAFIVPAPWEKFSIHNRLPLGWGLIASERLPEKSFELDGNPYAVRCAMQIWRKQDENGLRVVSKPDGTNPYFSFVTAEECDFAIRQVYPKTVLKSDIKEGGAYLYIKSVIFGVFAIFDSIKWQSEENRPLMGGASAPCLDKSTVVEIYEKHCPWVSNAKYTWHNQKKWKRIMNVNKNILDDVKTLLETESGVEDFLRHMFQEGGADQLDLIKFDDTMARINKVWSRLEDARKLEAVKNIKLLMEMQGLTAMDLGFEIVTTNKAKTKQKESDSNSKLIMWYRDESGEVKTASVGRTGKLPAYLNSFVKSYGISRTDVLVKGENPYCLDTDATQLIKEEFEARYQNK